MLKADAIAVDKLL